jgi:DNA ligase 1
MLCMTLLPMQSIPFPSGSTITPLASVPRPSRRKFAQQSAAWLTGLATLPALPTFAQTSTAQPPAAQPDAKQSVLLAQSAPKGINPTGYLVSEKLDGVRALWDGSVLRFRSGRTVAAPAWFTAKLPRIPLDGELWLGRGQFDKLSGMVRKVQPVDADWQLIQYIVFELPNGAGSFEQRAAELVGAVGRAAWPQLHAAEQFRLANSAALQAKLNAVTAVGGEGLMLHLASAPVVNGRSDVLLKLKPQQDAEATVIGHVPGKGKYAGQLGALEVQTAQGQRFKLGTGMSDGQRKNPPAIGSAVTYTYRDLTPSGKPRFASFLRSHFE